MLKRSLIAASILLSIGVNAQTTLSVGHAMNEESAAHAALEKFAEIVETKTNKDVIVNIFSQGRMGSEKEMADMVIKGELDIAKINGGLAEGFDDSYKVISMPYLMRSTEHLHSFMASPVAEDILNGSASKGFIGLTFLDSGSRSFYSSFPIKSPDDLKNKTVRVPNSATMREMITSLGGKPVSIAFGDVKDALATGEVDVAEKQH